MNDIQSIGVYQDTQNKIKKRFKLSRRDGGMEAPPNGNKMVDVLLHRLTYVSSTSHRKGTHIHTYIHTDTHNKTYIHTHTPEQQ